MKVVRSTTDAGKKLEKALKDLGDKVAKVGWFEKSKYPDPPNTPVAYVAAIHEYGYSAKNIPARPFMRPTIAEKQNEWRIIIGRETSQVLKGNRDASEMLELVGQKAAGDIRKTISLLLTPALKPATIAARLAKRSDKNTMGLLTKPLIDTGLMYGTLINTVETE